MKFCILNTITKKSRDINFDDFAMFYIVGLIDSGIDPEAIYIMEGPNRVETRTFLKRQGCAIPEVLRV